MKETTLAVIVPLSQQEKEAAGNRLSHTALRLSVWGRVSTRLQRWMGTEYQHFMPAVRPWGESVAPPYGVVLGSAEPHPFLHFFARAQLTREEVVRQRGERIASRGTTVVKDVEISKGLTVSVLACNGDDPEIRADVAWQMRTQQGALCHDAAVYYYAQGSSQVSEEVDKAILTHIADYALCLVQLGREEAP